MIMAKKCFNIHSISSLLTLLISFLFLSNSLISQDLFPDPGPVFRDDLIPRVDIIIPQDSLEELFAPGNEDSYHHYLADFIFDNGDIRDTIEDVGFRFRGNTSRHSQKKSYKISFNTYEKGRKFYGIEKMNLNGEHNDPSVIRSKLCWDLLR
jgi:spore coat protein CotH